MLFLVAGLFGRIAAETGDDAEDAVKLVAADIESFVHEHEEAADWAQISGGVVAVLAIGLEVAIRKKQNWVKALHWILLIFAIHSCTVFARTAFLGGLIRHTEIRD